MILVFNWKMNPEKLSDAEAILDFLRFAQDKLKKTCTETQSVEVWFAPPNLYFEPLRKKYNEFFDFGLQNTFYEQSGAFTGEISPKMAKNIGGEFVILGHSERKKLGESLEDINKKVLASLEVGLRVILCFGENVKLKSRENIIFEIKSQLKILLQDVPINSENLYLAYEPAWAISSQEIGPSSTEELKTFLDWYWQNYKFPIFYGGSVDSSNIENYLTLKLNGFLIGSASLKPEEITKILNIASK
mgnify:CR=1 FL=1